MPEENIQKIGKDPRLGELNPLLREIPVINTPPTGPPKYKTAIYIYWDGTYMRLYVYARGNWGYTPLTVE